jgi:hypothetical protein
MTVLKVCAIAVLSCLFVFCVASVGLVGYVATGGMATVSVDTDDTDFSIPVPMRILDLGLSVAGVAVPASEIRAAQGELHEALHQYRPVLEEMADQLDELPDGELVRVVTDDERVVVGHTGGKFRVEVLAPDTHVTVTVPRRAMSRVIRKTLELGERWSLR